MKKTNVILGLAAAVALTACGGSSGGNGGAKSSSSVTPSSMPASSVPASSPSSQPASSVPASVPSSSSEVPSSMASSSEALSSSSASSSSSGVDITSCENFNTLQGFAAQGAGVTGGADVGLGNNTVTVSNGADLNSVLAANNATYKDKPLTIYVNGPITWANSNNAEIRVRRSNVSIIGLPDGGEFNGVGIRVSHGASNILIRNLLMHEVPQANGAGDHIHLNGQDGAVSNIWIDHNEFFNDLTVDKDYYDELVSGRSRVHNVTISYNYLHDSQKTSLWGSSDNAAEEDVGRTISFHHNRWENVVSRLPLFRFGEGHVWNNYYSGVTGSGINSRMGAKMRVDNNVFESVKNPILSVDSAAIGYWNATGNLFTNVSWGGTSATTCSTPPCYAGSADSVTVDYQPPYSYTAQPASEVKTHVIQYAGRNKINSCLSLPEASSSSSSSSSQSSSTSSSAVSVLISETFDVDKATLFSAAYQSISNSAGDALYFIEGGSSGISIANNELTLLAARFTIGNRAPRADTTAADTTVNGDLDLSRPYKISFTLVARGGDAGKRAQVYVDNNVASAGTSVHGSSSKVWEAEALSLTPGQVVEITPTIGTATSFIQIRTETGASITIDNLKIEYL